MIYKIILLRTKTINMIFLPYQIFFLALLYRILELETTRWSVVLLSFVNTDNSPRKVCEKV